MHLNKNEIAATPHLRKINLINSITGIKPANLIGTRSTDNFTNLAIISSVIHLGSNPAIIGFIMRPDGEVRRDTFENIKATNCYTINHIHEPFAEQAHYTSAKFDREISEFEKCMLTEEYIEDFFAPFVKESQIKLGMKLLEIIPIKINGTIMVVGEIEHMIIPEDIITEEGYLDLEKVQDVGISGLNNYYSLKHIGQFPYARPNELPFDKSKK